MMPSASFLFVLTLVSLVAAIVHDVQVGPNSTLTYFPSAISADVGDEVIFTFFPKAHSVTQSSLAAPCDPKPGGIDSGLMPVAPGTPDSELPTFRFTVNDTGPTWIYCKQGAGTPDSHCGKGMVFAVNCGPRGSNNSIDTFQAAALAVGASLSSAAATPTAPAAEQEVTETITLQSSTWTTTYSSYPGSPNPTPASLTGNVINVDVGDSGSLKYSPSFVSASPLDTVIFKFHQKNHTVTQSTFNAPCRPLGGGFDSGFMPVAENQATLPTFSVKVNDTNPVWVYCRQTGHCGKGMVFAINSVESSLQNFSAFQARAISINGTSSNSTTSSPTSGASALSQGSAGIILALAAVLVGLI